MPTRVIAQSGSTVEVAVMSDISGGGDITSDQISDATTVGKDVLTADDAAAARAAIGAGTSSLAIGTTSTTAMAGNLAATTAAIGGVKKMAAQTDSTATDVAGLVTDFNALLAKARTAGLM